MTLSQSKGTEEKELNELRNSGRIQMSTGLEPSTLDHWLTGQKDPCIN